MNVRKRLKVSNTLLLFTHSRRGPHGHNMITTYMLHPLGPLSASAIHSHSNVCTCPRFRRWWAAPSARWPRPLSNRRWPNGPQRKTRPLRPLPSSRSAHAAPPLLASATNRWPAQSPERHREGRPQHGEVLGLFPLRRCGWRVSTRVCLCLAFVTILAMLECTKSATDVNEGISRR